MKKIHILFLACLLAMTAVANPITRQQAHDKAKSFLSRGWRKGMPRSNESLSLVAVRHYSVNDALAAPCYYVFNVGSDGGFVVVGGDDLMPSILGYAGSGTFDETSMPENKKAWLDDYARQMAWLHSHPEAAARKVVTGGSISPLLETNWHQSSPYNDLCPKDGNYNSVTGCVATAMAQVMYYHKWPAKTTAEIPGYVSSTNSLTVDAISSGTEIDWDNMLPAYSGSETSTQRQAVAQLMAMCGASVEMDYGADGSGAYTPDVATALLTYFDYDIAIACEQRRYYTHAKWNQMIYDELAAGRPVVYSGSSSNGGHAFVIDGYGGDDFFHVNWGWSGPDDEYYLLSVLDPEVSSGIGMDSSIDGYSFGQCAIIGMQPNTNEPKENKVVLYTYSMSLPDGNTFTRSSTSKNFSFTVDANAYNLMGATYTFDCGAYGFFDEEDNLLSVACDHFEETLDDTWGYSSIPSLLSLGAGVTSGKYKIKAISRQTGTSTWYANTSIPSCYIGAVISGNTITLTQPTVSLSGTIIATGNKEAMTIVPLDITIINDGTFFCGEVYLLEDGKIVGGRQIEIDGGATVTLPFSYTPTSAGTKSLSLCRYVNNNYVPFATGNVTISAPVIANLSITSSISNATDGIVKENRFVINATIKNNGSSAYNKNVIVPLFKLRNDNSGNGDLVAETKEGVSLQPGKSTDIELTFNNLEDGATYFYYIYYYSQGVLTPVWGAQATVELEGTGILPGDVNGDGEVNVTDLIPLVNMILGITEHNTSADVNGDGEVNVTDLIPLVNLILNVIN